MEISFKKKTIEVSADEIREMHRQINILQHDYDVLNQEMTEVVKKLARVERKAYRNDPGSSDPEPKKANDVPIVNPNQFDFTKIPGMMGK